MMRTLLVTGTAFVLAVGLARAQDAVTLNAPVTVSAARVPTTPPMSCQQHMDAAIAAFHQEDFDEALASVKRGLDQCPNDPSLHEFRGLVLFAKGSYQEASASVHLAIAVRPAWNWKKVGRLYSDIALYTKQLRALEAFTKKHPDDNAARFLQAYHYLVIGYPESAARELEMVIRLESSDRVAAELLKGLPKAQSIQPTPAGALGIPTQRPNY